MLDKSLEDFVLWISHLQSKDTNQYLQIALCFCCRLKVIFVFTLKPYSDFVSSKFTYLTLNQPQTVSPVL